MSAPKPPPPRKTQSLGARLRRGDKILLGLALVIALFCVTAVALRVLGLLRPFYIPTGSMTPAILPGDCVAMEGITFWFRKPRRGDIVIFKTDRIPFLPPATIYEKRVVGEPGERLRIAEGKLFINGQRVSISNAAGEIKYDPPPRVDTLAGTNESVIPAGCYFLIGDNATNSLDSRMYGPVPRSNILGRVWLCYWPLTRAGRLK